VIHKGSKRYSVLHGLCHHCQEGKVFRFDPYKKLVYYRMNDHCLVCTLAFEPELGRHHENVAGALLYLMNRRALSGSVLRISHALPAGLET
jgi:hypothetical protein